MSEVGRLDSPRTTAKVSLCYPLTRCETFPMGQIGRDARPRFCKQAVSSFVRLNFDYKYSPFHEIFVQFAELICKMTVEDRYCRFIWHPETLGLAIVERCRWRKSDWYCTSPARTLLFQSSVTSLSVVIPVSNISFPASRRRSGDNLR